jgi:hypothetical protein
MSEAAYIRDRIGPRAMSCATFTQTYRVAAREKQAD